MKRNSSSRVRRALRAGNIATVLKINLSDPRVAELAGLAEADAIWLCNEHVPNDWTGIEHQIRAAALYGMDALVRVERGSYSDYIRPLEAGAAGIIVPHTSNAAEAKQIVEWCRFHPMGKRPLDGGNVDGLFCQLPIEEYVQEANNERLIILQIESPEALEHVEEIAAVPGYDALLFGAGDFCHRIGKIGKIDLPEVDAARKRIGAAALRHGKVAAAPGLLAPLEQMAEEGYRIFGVGSDVFGLGNYFKERVATMRGHIKAIPPLNRNRPVYT